MNRLATGLGQIDKDTIQFTILYLKLSGKRNNSSRSNASRLLRRNKNSEYESCMAHLTRAEIERKLLLGNSISWIDGNEKKQQILLGDAKERRVFEFLLSSKVRKATDLPDDFIKGLQAAYDSSHDPALTLAASSTINITSGPWKLQTIETEGFGGINTWNADPFRYDFNCESLLLEGPNGSGKSSLTGAILWALTGERPRDQAPSAAHEPKAVFGATDHAVGEWPPLATYPPTAADLKSPAHVLVKLTFRSPTTTATVERKLSAGNLTKIADPIFDVPSILLETGLLMPARLAVMRFDEGRGRLTDAVQKLTGLDDLIEVGALTDGICNKAREYRSYKKRELKLARDEFDKSINAARDDLDPIGVSVPRFTPIDTDNPNGAMAEFGRMLVEKSKNLTEVISSDLATNLDLGKIATQNQVIGAIETARSQLSEGIESIPLWKTLKSIATSFDEHATQSATKLIARSRASATEAIALRAKATQDTRFQLKALAASWHAQHKSGAIDNCPLCESSLKNHQVLTLELESLRSAGVAATRTFEDSIARIKSDLEAAIPTIVKIHGSDVATWEPRGKLINDIRSNFVAKDTYSKILVGFSAIVATALKKCPQQLIDSKPNDSQNELQEINDRIAIIERLLELAAWFNTNSTEWETWWSTTSTPDGTGNADAPPGEMPAERLSTHLSRLSDALEKAGPYRRASQAIRTAWASGKAAATIEQELKRREAIAESLTPLKDLKKLCEAIARGTIDELSLSIADLLQKIHLNENLRFQDARLDRKEGLVVHGGFVQGLRINATLVANTSWLRAILWAFIFALRDQAIKLLGNDTLPAAGF